MSRYLARLQHGLSGLVILSVLVLAFGCASAPPHQEKLPPLLTQEELLCPYERVAEIQVQRERYGFSDDLSPVDYSWVYQALRQEAARIGAEAVILPEVTVEMQTFTFWPVSEMRGKGVAIKFH